MSPFTPSNDPTEPLALICLPLTAVHGLGVDREAAKEHYDAVVVAVLVVRGLADSHRRTAAESLEGGYYYFPSNNGETSAVK